MQQYNDEFLERWEHLINEVNKTEVPLECIKKIVVRLNGKKQKTINLGTLRKQGLDWEEIETVITRTLSSYGDTVADLEFVLDIVSVAEIIQPETDKLLSSLK
jgi:hypothetical protein